MKELLGLAVLAWPLTLSVLILIAFVVAVSLATGYAKRTGRSQWRWGVIGFLVVYLPIFWDWLPTVAVHQYYCATESGFWVYKTLDQWKKENPGVMETLVYNKASPPIQTTFGPGAILNQRFNYFLRYEGPLLFNRWRIEREFRDSKNGDVIAREIGFSTSQEQRQAGWSGWKFWLDSERCSIEKHRDQGSFYKIMAQFEGAKE